MLYNSLPEAFRCSQQEKRRVLSHRELCFLVAEAYRHGTGSCLLVSLVYSMSGFWAEGQV